MTEDWHPLALKLHLTGRWRGRDVRDELGLHTSLEHALGDTEARFAPTFQERGSPPSHFFHREDSVGTINLPEPAERGRFSEILADRRTTRRFDRSGQMSLSYLANLLGTVWGCTGVVRVTEGFFSLRKSSPSGGGLHACEVYPIIRAVEGAPSGVYHYDVERHALGLLMPMVEEKVFELMTGLLVGQDYFSDANVFFVSALRFDRLHWKYPQHERAYLVAAMELGHLAQTLYLAATEAGLGAFVTAAVNSGDIDDILGLDGVTSSALAVSGCGWRSSSPTDLHPTVKPFTPNRVAEDGV
jgi:putative peptide maturation dehydrogenase